MNNNSKTHINVNRIVDGKSGISITTTTFIYMIGIIVVLWVGIFLYNQYKKWKVGLSILSATKEGNIILECPDYWETVGINKCKNINKIGTCNIDPSNNIMDFNDEIFTNPDSGEYSKCRFAKDCNIVWGGVDKAC